MKKRSIAAKLGVAALALTLITTSLSSGTFAKYITALEGGATVSVAQWNVAASLTNKDGTQTKVMQGTLDPNSLMAFAKTADGTKKQHVSAEKIAPGMKGQIGVTINPASGGNTETAILYDVYVKQNDTMPQRLKMWDAKKGDAIPANDRDMVAVNEEPTDGIGGDVKNGKAHRIASGAIAAGYSSQVKAMVNWEWPYEDTTAVASGDAKDITDAETASRDNLVFVVVMKQANPNVDIAAPYADNKVGFTA